MCASELRDAIAERQQGVHKVDVLEENAVLLGGELHIGKIPEAAHTQADQTVRQRLGYILRDGQDRHVGVIVGDIFLQLCLLYTSDAADD